MQKAMKELDVLDAQTDATRQNIEESKSRIDLNSSNIAVNDQRVKNMQQEIKESLSRMRVNDATIRKLNAEIPVLVNTANKLSAEERRIVIENLSAPNAQIKKQYTENMMRLDEQMHGLKNMFEESHHGNSGVGGLIYDIVGSALNTLGVPRDTYKVSY